MPSVETADKKLRFLSPVPTPLADVRHAVALIGFMATTPLWGGRLRNSRMVASEGVAPSLRVGAD